MALSGPEWGGRISRICLQSNICDSILIFVPNIWGVIKLDCYLWPCVGGREQFLECMSNPTSFILFSFLCLKWGIIKFDCFSHLPDLRGGVKKNWEKQSEWPLFLGGGHPG